MGTITAVRGFKDILPDETAKWQHIERTARSVFSSFGIREIKIPVLEKTELFSRGIGETTDIVEKEMYTFLDRDKESLTLRPEATASVIRAYIEHHLYATAPLLKLFTIGPMFRRERPQKGRFRQFHQINVEYLGEKDPRVDAELIFMLMHFLGKTGLPSLKLEINSLGCPMCRSLFRDRVVSFLETKKNDLCDDCKRRLTTNPLRIFDCKVPECKQTIAGAPVIIDFICAECSNHFEGVKGHLTALEIPYALTPTMVRGLDYYTNTAFEVTTNLLGAQNAVAGGGRYDGLVKLLGGPDLPGIGFAVGLDRLAALIPEEDFRFAECPHLFIAVIGDRAQDFSFRLANELRRQDIYVETDIGDKGLKSQMKRANKLGCSHTLIVGDAEMDNQRAILRDMTSGNQDEISLSSLEILSERLKATGKGR